MPGVGRFHLHHGEHDLLGLSSSASSSWMASDDPRTPARLAEGGSPLGSVSRAFGALSGAFSQAGRGFARTRSALRAHGEVVPGLNPQGQPAIVSKDAAQAAAGASQAAITSAVAAEVIAAAQRVEEPLPPDGASSRGERVAAVAAAAPAATASASATGDAFEDAADAEEATDVMGFTELSAPPVNSWLANELRSCFAK